MFKNQEHTYRALISDFDNTLVGKDKKVTSQVAAKIIKLQEIGYIFALATGRAYAGYIAEAARDLALIHPIVVRGGAEIVNPGDGKILYSKYIDASVAQSISAHLTAANLPFVVEDGDTAYVSPTFDAQKAKEFPLSYPIEKCLFTRPIPKIYVSSNFSESEIDHIIAGLEQEFAHTASIQKILSGTRFGLDILAGGVTKHSGVLEWMLLCGLSPNEVVAIGDGYNDFALLAACGYKVAVGNAHEDLKQLADFITPPQAEDGILTIINQLLLSHAQT